LTDQELDEMVPVVVESGSYRIPHRIRPRPRREAPAGMDLKQTLFVDLENIGFEIRTIQSYLAGGLHFSVSCSATLPRRWTGFIFRPRIS
jgi:hypothetical protein